MAKRGAEVDDDGEQRAVFIDTSLDTHFVLLVSPNDTLSLLKQKILVEHSKCFPDYGEIKINAVKVKRRGCYYHLLDSMLVKTAFYGVAKNWFLLADLSSQTACSLIPSNIISTGPSKPLPLLVRSSKHLESRIEPNVDDHFGSHSSDANKMLGFEIPNNFDLSGVHTEPKSVEGTLNAGDSWDSSIKKNKKKRKRTGEHDDAGDENMEKLEDLRINHVEKEPPSTENTVRNVGYDMKLTSNVTGEASPSACAKKKPKIASKDAQETSLSKTKSFVSDTNRVSLESEAVVSKTDQGDMQRSGSDDLSGLPSSETSTDIRKRKTEKRHASSQLPSSVVNDKENLMHIEDHVHNASASATDAVPKFESIPVHRASAQSSALGLTDGDNSIAEDVFEGTDPRDMQRSGSIDVSGLPSSETFTDIRKRKKEKKHASFQLPSAVLNDEENLMPIEDHVHNASAAATDAVAKLESLPVRRASAQSSALLLADGDNSITKAVHEGTDYQGEGTSTRLDKLVNDEIESDKIGLAPEPRSKKTKKSKKVDVNGVDVSNLPSEMPNTSKNGCAPTQDENNIHGQENSVPGSMGLGTKAKKKKVKKEKVSTKDKTDLSSMENNKETATFVLSNGIVENANNYDITYKSDKGGTNHESDKKRDLKVKLSSSCSQDGDHEADGTGKIREEQMHTSEIKEPDVSAKIRAEKAKRKTKKRQTVSVKDTPEVSVEEQPGEKMIETDVPGMANVKPLGNGDVDGSKNLTELAGDLQEDINKTPLIEVAIDVTEERKTDSPRASKRRVKRHDLPSSVDTSCSGHNMVTSKKSRGSGRTSHDGTRLRDDDGEAECMRHISTETVHSPPMNKNEDNVGITSDEPKKRTEKRQTALKDPPQSPVEQQFDEKTREMAVPNSANGDLLANAAVNDANHRGGLLLREDHSENLDDIHVSHSAGLAEVSNQDKTQTSKEDVKKLDLPSSMDTSSNQTSKSKSKKSKESKRTSQNVTQLQEPITEQHQDVPLTQPSERHCGTAKEGIEPQAPHADPDDSVAKVTLHNRSASARKSGGASAGLRDGSKLPGAPTVSSLVGKSHQGKKTTELQKKPGENHMGSRRSSLKNMGEAVNGSPQRKGLLSTPGAIFEDGSSASSDEEDKMEGSDSSTRTPSDNLSASDYSEGESKGYVVTSRHDASKGGGQDGTNPKSSDFKNMPLHSILRSSSRYKKAKVVASQSQLEGSEPVDFVPDSQGNL